MHFPPLHADTSLILLWSLSSDLPPSSVLPLLSHLFWHIRLCVSYLSFRHIQVKMCIVWGFFFFHIILNYGNGFSYKWKYIPGSITINIDQHYHSSPCHLFFFSLITQLYTCCLLCLNTHPFSPSLHLSLSFKCFLRRFQTAKDAGDISKCPIVFHSQELCTPSRAQFICCRLEPKYCHLPWLAERCVKTQEANLRAANFFPVARCSHSDSQWQILSDIFWRESQRKREKKRSLCTKAHQAWLTVTYDVIFSSEVIFMSNLMCVFFESPDFSCCRKFM